MSRGDHLPESWRQLQGKTIRDTWAAYRERVVPAEASVEQVEATRVAFYAGATALRDLVLVLFETIEALKDEEKPMDLARARAVADVARVVVDSAKVEVRFLEVTGGLRSTGFLPEDTDEGEETTPRRKLAAAGGRGRALGR